jgi:hypothetical protein
MPFDRSDFVAAHVLGNQRRARQIRPGFAAAGIAAVTETALRREARLTGSDEFGRIGLWRHRWRDSR